LTVKLFEGVGLEPRIAEVADEKQTIVDLVAARLGAAIVPRWTSRMAILGVRFVPLKVAENAIAHRLPLAVGWLRGSRDSVRDAILDVLAERLEDYAKNASRAGTSRRAFSLPFGMDDTGASFPYRDGTGMRA
jgi:DNA-binding transcriptional LysR family regulator